MLNVRMNSELKNRGAQVLKRYDLSVTDYVRACFEYLERNQTLPDFARQQESDPYEEKRLQLRALAGCAADNGAPASPINAKSAEQARIDEKYARYLA